MRQQHDVTVYDVMILPTFVLDGRSCQMRLLQLHLSCSLHPPTRTSVGRLARWHVKGAISREVTVVCNLLT